MAEKKQWHETLHDQFGQYFAVDNVLYHEKTDHQDLIIFENAAFGRVMALDGVVQTTERDEFIYHEMMTHVPLLAHGHAKHVLIIGGGDGAMLREVTRHKNVESITMVEIDAGVVSFCRQYLPNHNAGSYDDPRFKLVIDDGVNFVNQTSQTFDVIISDCTDPIGPGESLFTSVSSSHKTASAFYSRKRLSTVIANSAITSATLAFIRRRSRPITAAS